MGRRARIPDSLTLGPFEVREAEEAGLTRGQLRSRPWQRVAVKHFVFGEAELTPIQRLHIAQRRLPADAVFSGLTAAWLHHLDVMLASPIEATAPLQSRARSRSGMTLHRANFTVGETTRARGYPVTSLPRTLRDLCARSSLTEAVVLVDSALHLRRVKADVLKSYVTTHARTRGIAMMRRALPHAEPRAESPMESRTRMLFVLSGLPRPEAQVAIYDSADDFVARLDLFYREAGLGIEFDGAAHDGNLVADNRRQNRLLDAGVRLLRFTAADIYQHPKQVVSQVRRMLAR